MHADFEWHDQLSTVVVLRDSERAYASKEESKDPEDLSLTMLTQEFEPGFYPCDCPARPILSYNINTDERETGKLICFVVLISRSSVFICGECFCLSLCGTGAPPVHG